MRGSKQEVPRTSSNAAVPHAAGRRQGSAFSARTIAATRAIQRRLMMPRAKSDAISAQQQPAHQRAAGAPHPEGAEGAGSPRPEQEGQRVAAAAEARVLERRELVEGGDQEGRTGDPAAGRVPGEKTAAKRPPTVAAANAASPVAAQTAR